MMPEERARRGLQPPGAASGAAGVEARLDAVLDELAAIRQALQALAARRLPPAPAPGTARLKEPAPAPPPAPRARKGR